MRQKILALFLIIFTFLSLNFNIVFALDISQIKYESINPGNDLMYNFKRLQEKVILLFFSPFPAKKYDYYLGLLDVRLAELKYIVDKKDIANIETTSGRYSATVGEASEFIIQKNLHDRKSKLVDKLKNHLRIVESLEGAYDSSKAEWRLIRYDSDYLKEYISNLQK